MGTPYQSRGRVRISIEMTAQEKSLISWTSKRKGFKTNSKFIREAMLAYCRSYYLKEKQKAEAERNGEHREEEKTD